MTVGSWRTSSTSSRGHLRGQSELVSMPVSPEALAELKQRFAVAGGHGKTEVQGPGCPKPMPVAEADRITQTFDEARDDARAKVISTRRSRNATPMARLSVMQEPRLAVKYCRRRLCRGAPASPSQQAASPTCLRP